MYAETPRTILEAQTKGQQQMFIELMKRMERMVSAPSPTVPTATVVTAEFIMNSLSTRHLPESKDSATLDDAAKVRLVVSKLDAVTYAHFTNHILPERACDVLLTDNVAALMKLFGHNTSVFARRYAHLNTQRSEKLLFAA
ncbi:hypothetical protein RB195_023416 [Necator americanus]|uniref:DUF7083 domain-containing protein n=1 Tax=Necator americanus TaxID=51031 RepID=A0ABR1EJN6_NECAM